MKRLLLCTCPLVVFAWQPHSALAQTVQAEAEPQDGIGDIIVTAQKRAQALDDVGQTINVVDADLLAQRNITTAADLSKVVPGFTVAANGDGTPVYTLRGISFNSVNFGTAPTVSVYIDEAPLPFSVMTQGALLDLERVEVLKGPQGTLFGQNSTAGAINYIAAKPTPRLEAGARLTYGRFDTVQGEGFVSGPLTETLEARLAFSGTRSGPWQRSATRDDEIGRQRKLAGRLLLEWEPSDRLRFGLNVNGWLDKSDAQIPQFVEPRPANPAETSPLLFAAPITTRDARDADWNANERFRRNNRFYQVALRADLELGDDVTLTSLTDYTDVRIRSRYDKDGTALPINSLRNTGDIQAISQELRLAGELSGGRLNYIVGASFQHDESFESDLLVLPLNSATRITAIGSIDTVIQEGDQRNRTWAAFGNLDFELTDQLTLSAGVRQTSIKHFSVGCSRDSGDGSAAGVLNALSGFLRGAVLGLPPGPTILPGACATLGPDFAQFQQDESFKEDSTSWRFNVNYKPGDDALLYATASRGYKGGNYPVLAASSSITLSPVLQEKLTAYEVGTKFKLFDRRLAVNAAFYYYDYRDKQLQTNVIDPVFNLLLRYVNVPKSTVRGFDVDLTVVPVTGLTLRSAVTYADSRIGRFSGFDVFGAPVDLTGKPFNLAPDWVSVSDAEYRAPLGDNLETFVGAGMTYNSRTYADLAGSSSFLIRGFTTFDLRAGLRSEAQGWELLGFIRNVGDEYTWNYAESGGDSVLRYANPPQTYGLTLSYRY